MAAGEETIIASDDGQKWDSAIGQLGPLSDGPSDLKFGGGTWITMLESFQGFLESSNGLDWIYYRLGESDIECQAHDAIAYGNGKWFGVRSTIRGGYVCAKTTTPGTWRLFLEVDDGFDELHYANGDWITLKNSYSFFLPLIVGTWRDGTERFHELQLTNLDVMDGDGITYGNGLWVFIGRRSGRYTTGVIPENFPIGSPRRSVTTRDGQT